MNVILSRILEEKSTLLDVRKCAVHVLILTMNITRVPALHITSKTGLIQFNIQCKTADYMLYTSL